MDINDKAVTIATALIGAAATITVGMMAAKVGPFRSDETAIPATINAVDAGTSPDAAAAAADQEAAAANNIAATDAAGNALAAPAPVNTAPPAPQGAIMAHNQCKDKVTAKIFYEDGDGWQTSSGEHWNFEAGEASFPTFHDRYLIPKAGIFYVWAKRADGTQVTTDDYTQSDFSEQFQKFEAGPANDGYTHVYFCS